jgi:hypothetical protein
MHESNVPGQKYVACLECPQKWHIPIDDPRLQIPFDGEPMYFRKYEDPPDV